MWYPSWRVRRILRYLLLALLISLTGLVTPAVAQGNGVLIRKEALAVRIADDAIRLDGRLDEAVWSDVPAVTDFVQKEPVEGAAPSEPMEVRFAYDNGALYVGARMRHRSPDAMQAPLGRRDSTRQAEHILVSLDTYLDHRTAYSFGVTASGVRLDHYHPADEEGRTDPQFDPVWEARATIVDDGWTAELWIPFSQLRFTTGAAQVWGVNVQRWIPSRNEDVYWVLIPRTVQGWASRFGELRGIQGVQPTRRIELVPYVGGTATVTAEPDAGNPFADGRDLGRRIGADLKMGLGPNLTLDATVNPDFGQVEADPAEVNLTAFETFFSERRPFFIEGSQVLTSRVVTNYFYSRRIGARPTTPVSGDHVDYPRESRILGAAKLTGRLRSGTALGLLAAVTDAEHARVFDVGSPAPRIVSVAPRTSFAVARVEQEFGPYQSTASAMVTALYRHMGRDDPLASRLARTAISANGDSVLRFRGGEYQIGLQGGFTAVAGEPAAIVEVQRSAVRYFQRPDADYVIVDPTRRRLVGFKGGANVERTSGRHWLWSTRFDLESPELETNDLGRLSAGDGIQLITNLRYRETQPGRLLRSYALDFGTQAEWNFGRDRQNDNLTTGVSVTWPNFWSTSLGLRVERRAQDHRLTRGGPSMQTPQAWNVNTRLSNSSAAQHGWSGRLDYGRDEDGGLDFVVGSSVSIRPAPRWQFSFGPEYVRQLETQQYVAAIARTGEATFGRRYIFAFIDRSTLAAQFRLSFTLKPDLTIDVYAEPFAASGDYFGYGELAAARSRDRLRFGTGGSTADDQADGSLAVREGLDRFTLRNRDFNVLSFRSNVVLKWEWRPGSTLYAVWQQDRSSALVTDARIGGGDLFDSLNAAGLNYFVVKASFWVPMR